MLDVAHDVQHRDRHTVGNSYYCRKAVGGGLEQRNMLKLAVRDHTKDHYNMSRQEAVKRRRRHGVAVDDRMPRDSGHGMVGEKEEMQRKRWMDKEMRKQWWRCFAFLGELAGGKPRPELNNSRLWLWYLQVQVRNQHGKIGWRKGWQHGCPYRARNKRHRRLP